MPKKGCYKDLSGQKFNRLTVISFNGIYRNKSGKTRAMWKCKCDCGKETIVDGSHLQTGHTKSCGCYLKEIQGQASRKTGMSGSKLYLTYYNIKHRCYDPDNPGNKYYGSRGITMCDEWLGEHGFENFMKWSFENGYEENKGLSIDRIDNDKGYSPENCRWVNAYIQQNNKRNNRFLCINGVVDTVANHARRHNVDYWNLMHYSKGGKNCKYPHLNIRMVTDAEIKKYRKNQSYRPKESKETSCG